MGGSSAARKIEPEDEPESLRGCVGSPVSTRAPPRSSPGAPSTGGRNAMRGDGSTRKILTISIILALAGCGGGATAAQTVSYGEESGGASGAEMAMAPPAGGGESTGAVAVTTTT